MTRSVLIVEDDDALARLLGDNLVYEGFVTQRAADAPEALARLDSQAFDLVLLDLTLPRGDGLDVCRELSARCSRPPIIVLSARGQREDRIQGLRLGADDYVSKPFDLEELLARIHAVLRRGEPHLDRLTLGDTLIDFRAHSARRAGVDLCLSHRELQVLQYLAEHAGRVVSRDELLQAVWGYREAPLTRAVDIAIARLRRKIEPDPRHPRHIRTLHGDGYCLVG